MSEWPGQLTHCMRKSFTRSNLAVRKLPTISIVILKVKVEKHASKPQAMSMLDLCTQRELGWTSLCK